ncbi:MAG: hypothetical protein JWP13_919 [Candidatus Saccharibacteria bacterium]|nr:hypothetical protein [Candidatus Saccharibacteria bacterium]
MANYLIVGLPGVGKSELAHELMRRGYDALDADLDAELSLHAHCETGLMKRELSPAEAASGEFHWTWNGDRLTALLGSYATGSQFVLGNAANVKDYYHLFDKVFALVADNATLTHRVVQRGSGYGITPAELEKILGWNESFKEHEIERGAIIIEASPPVAEIADTVLEYTHAD